MTSASKGFAKKDVNCPILPSGPMIRVLPVANWTSVFHIHPPTMDPVTALGVAGTVAQFAEQTLRISDCLYQYFKGVKNAPAKSRELRQEALLLSDVLETLTTLFSANKKPTVLPSLSQYEEMLQEFKETIAEMAKKVEIKKGKLSFKRLAWPFTEKENEKYLARMERFKGSFQLALQALQSYDSAL
jgi:Fungal N-terminal domain of STAND proteins